MNRDQYHAARRARNGTKPQPPVTSIGILRTLQIGRRQWVKMILTDRKWGRHSVRPMEDTLKRMPSGNLCRDPQPRLTEALEKFRSYE